MRRVSLTALSSSTIKIRLPAKLGVSSLIFLRREIATPLPE
jgi:hypothetical protein